MELIDRTIHPFSIHSKAYESEMDQKHGIVLANLRNGQEGVFQGDLEKNISFNRRYRPYYN